VGARFSLSSSICTDKQLHAKDKETIMWVAYELTPPPEMTQEDFVRFVQEEVFPAVNMQPTRVGMIVELHLLTTRAADKYHWVITWDGLTPETTTPIAREMEAARQKLDSSGTLISAPSPFYNEVATRVWSADSGSKETAP
jgi:hypothetical protein